LGAYLGVRWDLFMGQIGITEPARAIFHPGIDPNPLGYRIRHPGLDSSARAYVGVFSTATYKGTAIQRVWIYLLLSLAAAVVLLRRGRPGALKVVGAMGICAFTLQLGLFFAAPSERYRFEEPTVLAGLIGLAVLLKLGSEALRRRRGHAQALT
jgi:hypothetical protein